jgi:hypothetical protein
MDPRFLLLTMPLLACGTSEPEESGGGSNPVDDQIWTVDEVVADLESLEGGTLTVTATYSEELFEAINYDCEDVNPDAEPVEIEGSYSIYTSGWGLAGKSTGLGVAVLSANEGYTSNKPPLEEGDVLTVQGLLYKITISDPCDSSVGYGSAYLEIEASSVGIEEHEAPDNPSN